MIVISTTEPSAPAQPAKETRITKRAFILRLTEKEYTDIDLASFGQTEQASRVRRFIEMYKQSPFFDLALPDNLTALQQLEAAGLLGPGRASEIINTPARQDEEFR